MVLALNGWAFAKQFAALHAIVLRIVAVGLTSSKTQEASLIFFEKQTGADKWSF